MMETNDEPTFAAAARRRLVDPTTYGRATVPSRGIDPAELPVSREAPPFLASKLPPGCISRQV